MKIPRRVKCVLIACLILLNIILRLPSTPHEIGADSFLVHILANSISTFGYAKWWASPFSIGGFYPLSEPSSVPFFISGISQLTKINMEWTIWLYCMILGIFSIFAIYILAGTVWDNDLFKFLVAFGYTTSPGIVYLTTWTTSARGLFVVMLPIFIYFLLKYHINRYKKCLLFIGLFLFLLVTHNFIYLTGPIIMAYIILAIIYKLKDIIKSTFNNFFNINTTKLILKNFENTALFVFFILMFLIPFTNREIWESDPEIGRSNTASRYSLLFFMAENYLRYIGPLIIIGIGSFIYLMTKENKRFSDWFIILTIIILAPFLYIPTYMKWFILPVMFLLIGIGLINIIEIIKKHVFIKNYTYIYLSIILLLSIGFTGYFQFIHFSINKPWYDRYMPESSYSSAIWINHNIDKTNTMFFNDGQIAQSIFSISEVPTLFGGAMGLSYGFYKSIYELNLTENSPYSINYYKQGPVVKRGMTPDIDGNIGFLLINEFYSRQGKSLISKYNLSYVIEKKVGYNGERIFMNSVKSEKNIIYDNGRIGVWSLK